MPRADAAERAALPTPQGQARDLRIFAGKKDDKRYARSCWVKPEKFQLDDKKA